MAGRGFSSIKQAPGPSASNELKSGIHKTQPASMLEAGVEVSNLAQLRNDPALINELFVTLQLLR